MANKDALFACSGEALQDEQLAVELERVCLRYGAFSALAPISLDVPRGQFVALVGPTGCGKSSLLNLVAGLVKPTEGIIRTAGRTVDGVNRNCGYMFQADALMPWRSAIDNVRLGPILRGVEKSEATALAHRWLERVGLTGWHDRYIHQLSGGQCKRVAMAQVLINRLPILLMDEPFAALDAQTRVLMEQELLEIWEDLQATVLFVTHDLEEAVALADRVILFTAGPEATLKGDYLVGLSRPRLVAEARFMDGFAELYEQLWNDLREEVMATYAHGRAS